MTITDELRVVIEAEVERAVRDMQRWEQTVGSSDQKLEKIQKSMDAASRKMALFSGAMIGIGAAGIKAAAGFERQEKELEVLLGSASEAEAMFGRLSDLSAETPLQLGDVTKTAQDLLNFNVSASQVEDTIRMLGDASRGNASALETVTRAYGRVQLKGKASMEELNMLTEAGIPILTELADQLEVSTEELFNMVSAGQVSSQDVQDAFIAMTSEGGRFHDMMKEVSETTEGRMSTALDNLKLTLGDLAEEALPMVNDILIQVTEWSKSFRELDDDTKALILRLIGIGAIAAPMAKAGSSVLGFSRLLMGLAATNPVVLGIGAVAAAVGGLSLAFIQTKENMADFEDGLENFNASKRKALEDAETYSDISRTVPGMTPDMFSAAKDTGEYELARAEADKAARLMTRIEYLMEQQKSKNSLYTGEIERAIGILEKPVNPDAEGWWQGQTTDAERFSAALEMLDLSVRDVNGGLKANKEYWDAVKSGSSDALLEVLRNVEFVSPEIAALQEELERIQSGETIGGPAKTSAPAPEPPEEPKKAWQDWFEEITEISKEAFGSSGREAGRLYIESLQNEFSTAGEIGDLLGEEIDPLPFLEDQRNEIKNTLKELFTIDPDDINDPFKTDDATVQIMIAKYKELSEAIAAAKAEQAALAADKAMEERASALVKTLKTPYDLLQDQIQEITDLQAAGHLSEQEALALSGQAWENYNALIAQTNDEIRSFHDLIATSVSSSLMDGIDVLGMHIEMTKEAADAYGELAAQLVNLGLETTLDSFKELGKAFEDGKISGEEFGQVMAKQAQAILNQLPLLFLQAGLQLIAQGQWALGLGFVFGGMAASFVSGYTEAVSGGSAEANALGNVFDQGRMVKAFAAGGSFTNSIVNAPTFFPMAAGGVGLMGEAGPEAIMPLTRGPGGELGVRAQGGAGSAVYVVINNYSGEDVQTNEKEDRNGERTIEVTIGGVVKGQMARGEYDGVLGGRYGVEPKGVRA